jgi:hypothetical protein
LSGSLVQLELNVTVWLVRTPDDGDCVKQATGGRAKAALGTSIATVRETRNTPHRARRRVAEPEIVYPFCAASKSVPATLTPH